MPQAVIAQTAVEFSPAFMAEEADRHSPADIRRAVAYWVRENRLDLADALVAAGISMHPDSEDIWAIGALFAEVNQDWALAQECLERLVVLQDQHVSPEVLHHLVRVMRCRSAYSQAFMQASRATSKFPWHEGLRQAHAELAALLESVPARVVNEIHAA